MNWTDILFRIFKVIKSLLPSGVIQIAEATKNFDPSKRLRDDLKKKFFANGYEWDKLNLIALRDTESPKNKQIFNDLIILADDTGASVYKCTTEPGKKWNVKTRNKYNISWVGLYPLGNYPDNYQVSTYKGMPALKQKGRVKLMDVAKGKLRIGGGCHLHGRKSTSDTVGYASAGCIVPKTVDDLKIIVGALNNIYEKDLITFTVFDMSEFNLIGVKT